MAVKIVRQDDATITLGWEKPAGQWGYVPTIDGSEILTDGKRHIAKAATRATVKIGKPRDGKPHRYDVTVLTGAKQGAVTGTAAPPLPGPMPNPPPAPGADNSLAQSWLILAENPLDALEAPAYYKLAVTADLGYRHFYTEEFFTRARAQGRVIVPWCDCRPSGGTSPEVAIQWMHELGAPFWMGQGEEPDQMDAAMSATVKPRVIVGDIAHMRPDQIAQVAARIVLWVDEAYRNCSHILDPAWPSWQNANAGIGGNCIAVYAEGPCTAMRVVEYVSRGLFVAGRDSAYGGQMTVPDYRALP